MARKTKQTGQSPGTDAANDGAPSTPQDPNVGLPSAQTFAAKAKDLDALREAVVDAAGVGAALWLSYLFLFFYLFIAAAAVTHRDFLFENPVKLPFLGVELPLLGFFVLGPLLFLILHAYVLLHFAMLADKVGVFHSELQAQIRDEDTRTRLRRQLPSNIFVQYLAGPYGVRRGVMGFMLRLIALITLAIFPIALLVFFQLQFLPYHNESIAWWLRITVLLDILLLWTLWPPIARGQTSWISWHDFRRPRIIAVLLASLVPLLLVFSIATFPGEWLHANLPSLRVPTQLPSLKAATSCGRGSCPKGWRRVVAFVKSMGLISLHETLVEGDVDLIARKPTSLWSNRLVLPGIDVTDHATFDSEDKSGISRETLSLRGRRLEGAVLIDSNLRKADLTAARLEGANLTRADLREAKLSCASRKMEDNTQYECAQLKGAKMGSAQLQDAALGSAGLEEVNLREANLQGANLYGANLRGAKLGLAQLQGAQLGLAQLQGAYLSGANLQGANLYLANLEGADFSSTRIRGRTLGAANLQGANLNLAGLQVADLQGAQLQGANLSKAGLQGANLGSAQLQGADLRGAHLQATKLHGAKLQGADLTGVEIWLASFPDGLGEQSPAPIGLPETSPLTPEAWDELKKQLRAISAGLDPILRASVGLDPILRDDAPNPNWSDWTSWKSYIDAAKEPSPDALSEYLADLACRHSGSAEGLARRAMAFDDEGKGDYAKPLAEALLNLSCEGAKGLTDDTRARLQGLASATARP